tara:strand:+ start:62 stop:532 length:471 start_codon:yes stop_codon:yes gene_type:complete
MGLLQSDVGYGRCDGETRLKRYRKAVTIISLAQAETALSVAEALDVGITLLSAPNATASAGPGWFEAVVRLATVNFPHVQCDAVLDCGDAPGNALAALRHGVKIIRYNGARQAAIVEIAESYGAQILQVRPESLNLADSDAKGCNLKDACRSWLSS